MPKSAGEIVAIVLIVIVCSGLRFFLASAGLGGGIATVAGVIVALLLIAATLLLRTYPAVGITIYVLLGLVLAGLFVYVNAYRSL